MKLTITAITLAVLSNTVFAQTGQVRTSGVQITGNTEIKPQYNSTPVVPIAVGEGDTKAKPIKEGTQIQGNTKIRATQHHNLIAVGKNKPAPETEPKKAE